MLSKKQITFFTIGLFVVIGTIMFIFVLRKVDFLQEIGKASPKQIKDLRFYKDYLRDNGDLDLPVKEQTDLTEFTAALKTIKSSDILVKSLNNKTWFKLRLKIIFDKEYFYTITIISSEDIGDLGVVAITQGQTIETNVGTYQSKEILKWAEGMQKKEGFEEIKGKW